MQPERRYRRTVIDPRLLRKLVTHLEADLTPTALGDSKLNSEWRAARSAGRTAATWQTWLSERVTQVALVWVLGTVFLRFCEDNGLIELPFIAGPGERSHLALDLQAGYFHQHPEKTDRDWLLAGFDAISVSPAAATLFHPEHNPMWTIQPSNYAAKELLAFWRQTDSQGQVLYDFTDPEWDTGFLGDLYQSLSRVARKTYALQQTPEFVEEFILKYTLDPAIEEFGLEPVPPHGHEDLPPRFRLIDPVCGSGQFLLGAFRRLLAAWESHSPGADRYYLVTQALESVHGVDKNPFAVALARFRLTLAAMRAAGVDRLTEEPGFPINIAVGDSLLHGKGAHGWQADFGSETSTFPHGAEDVRDYIEKVRILEAGSYHVVVANPPHIAPNDKIENTNYRAAYKTCFGNYSLSVPFAERIFQLAIRGAQDGEGAGYTGQITSNAFTKRAFGKKLVEEYFPIVELTHIIDTSGAYIPGYGTPTVILIGRCRHSRSDSTIRAVFGLQSEPKRPDFPSMGLAWQAILDHIEQPGTENPWVTVNDFDRNHFAAHPWHLRGGDASGGDPHTRHAHEWEAQARALVESGRYKEAESLITNTAASDAARARRLCLELGFITLPETDRRVVAEAWKVTATGHDFQFSTHADDPAPTEQLTQVSTAVTRATPSSVHRAPRHRSPQQSGAALEQATVDLLTRIFTIDPGKTELLLTRLRQQTPGTQFGHDIEFECAVAENPAVRCHVECKNLDSPITLKDIADKLAQQKFYHQDSKLDHWILISPHHDVSNELRTMLNTWEHTDEYPFSIQVWSPENQVRELFALEPAVYQAVYGHPPLAGEQAQAGQALALIKRRLTPRLRIDRVWHRYIENPGLSCFVNEDPRHFGALYANHLQLMATDDRGSLLDGTLMHQVVAWIHDDHGSSPSPLLLLADFGEGKSLFTYCLTRRLCEAFLSNPAESVFPLRLPLREYAEAGSGRALLERRLKELGAAIADWRTLAGQVKPLVILDGFDEMSADLSPQAITENLRGIESCLTELSGVKAKILVTSRQRILEGTRDWERTLDRLRQPAILRIASGSRQDRVRYLERFAVDGKPARVLANLRNLHDPIGLAAKPLFLQMIKETLTELPDDTFTELILYDTYILKSLRHKLALLADPDRLLTDTELIENITSILEDIAVRLQEGNLAFIYLKDIQQDTNANLARLLWQIRNQAGPRETFGPNAEEDATNRVGIRSLLKAVPSAPNGERWPVDFFHRSMREYFVARAIIRYLRTDTDRARRILTTAPLLPEIAHFASTILREKPEPAALATLERFARLATLALNTAYLGGNAITLLYDAGRDLADIDWSGLRLDHAQLRGANLVGARLVGTSLRSANLDNANLENADLTGADLEGVLLDETSQVLAVTALDGNRIIAAYEDKSLREWRMRPGASWESQVVAQLDHRAEHLQLTPQGRIAASGDGILSVLELGADESLKCCFRTSSRFRATILGAKTTLFAEEGEGGLTRLIWLDMATERALDDREIDAPITACAQVDGKLYAFATPEAIHLVSSDHTFTRDDPALLSDHGISCLDLRIERGNVLLLAAGHHDGTAGLARIGIDGELVPLWQHHLHDGPITAIVLDAEERVITGGRDRSVYVTPVELARPNVAPVSAHHLHLTLRCKNVKFDGVRTEHEQAKLRMYSTSTNGPHNGHWPHCNVAGQS